jgi:hypothetical protein
MVDFSKALKKRQRRIDLNPSAAERWMTCTASPKFIFENWDKVPPDDSNKFSLEGTTAHEVASAYLLDMAPDKSRCPTPIIKDMLWHGWNYAEYVNSLRESESTLSVEKKFPLWYAQSRNCIVDAAVVNPNSLHIIDYKYGEGIPVHPERNLQAVIYARSVLAAKPPTWDSYPITIHIYQPRGRSAETPHHVWATTWGEVWAIGRNISATAGDILADSDPIKPMPRKLQFAPSEKACQWCPAKGFCSARQTHFTKDIEGLEVISTYKPVLPRSEVISIPQLAAVLKHKSQIEKWLNDAEAYALSVLKGGGSIPGFKLVMSRGGNRYWHNPKQAAKLLLQTILKREEVIDEKVISPKQAEDLLGRHKFGAELMNLIAKAPGQPVIAPEDDPRESCLLNVEDEFEKLDDL